ncbi:MULTISPECIES: hypothetical protein [Clostridium]|jgi:hypothetical protein|nr:hypothetical protein [Clostridium beijerinckii]MDG5856465.1 hypothetical protein [Clostridium beijerinckii]NOV60705.1 hypothetical protein [Clostridium beijerinckii]NOV73207.1 hypothetical protein [Clostridium beijerinckii]NOW33436.1 hypothetical protein [Clostridium beijerinckii]NOW83100.1 hypothetical protein [Clostridium beijerinckii]
MKTFQKIICLYKANTPYKLDNEIITIPESYKPYTGPVSNS